ncbi:lipoate--protein ligase family protein [Candidatus Woesearchaeota archaeon]|nr:lipoate--protein ligase family protein [Candidatus Woesearchaeota archaeon]
MLPTFRLIEKGKYDAFTNMAIDEALAASAKESEVPVIRLGYSWKGPSVSLGINQSVNDANLKYCARNGIDVVRRPTGGQALLHLPEDFTYCVIAEEEGIFSDFQKSYREICSWIIGGLKILGIKAEFDGKNSILAEGRKIAGNAQDRRKGVVMQHGSIFHSLDFESMEKIFKIKKSEIRKKTACISDFGDFYPERAYDAFRKSFLAGKRFFVDELNDGDMDRVSELLDTKYKKDEWNIGDKTLKKGSCHVQWN